ncbi:MAG: AAA family ATPase [Sandaracinaceae bacterium]|nr:AAA family ATPase [Sandaracinaceae bacterium]
MDTLAAFNLHKLPFTREVAVREMLSLSHFEQARHGLLACLERRMSAAIIGPAGSGKSALCRALRDALPEARYRVHYVKVADLGKRDLCREVATAMGVTSAGSYPMLVRRIQEDFAQSGVADGVRPVLVIDEAHDIRPDVLGVLRILTNFDWDSRLVLSVVLAGQPRLETLLKKATLEDVAQRIAFTARLRLLSRDETANYLAHRCAIAGQPQSPFDPGSIEALFEMSQGNLRAIDRLALGALDEAATRGAKVVAGSDVVAARRRVLA